MTTSLTSGQLLNTLQLQEQVARGGAGVSCFGDIDGPKPWASVLRQGHRRATLASVVEGCRPCGRGPLLRCLSQARLVTEPTTRLVQHRTDLSSPRPSNSTCQRIACRGVGEALVLDLEVVGDDLPGSVTIETMGGRFRMERLGNGRFRHSFPSVRSALSFQFLANGWRSASYDVIPFAIPSIAHMNVVATPPAYTGAPQVDQDNQGDLTVPEGTPIQWTIRVQDGQGVSLRLNDDLLDVRALAGNTYATEHLASTNASYWIKPLGAGGVADSIRHRIRVIRDGKPSIQVEEMQDSTSRKLRHFSGAAQDDYGFSRLDFVWQYTEVNQRVREDLVAADRPVAMQTGGREALAPPSGSRGSFFHTWDMTGLDWREGDVLECGFELWDNDAVNGAKMVRSRTTTVAAPSASDIEEEREQAAEDIEEGLKEAAEQAAELREAMDAMQERLREQGEMTWQDRQAMEDLLEQQRALQEQLEQMREDNQRKDERASEFDPKKSAFSTSRKAAKANGQRHERRNASDF